MKILVTGAAGFIGFNLSKNLIAGGNTVVGIDNFDPYYDIAVKKSRVVKLAGDPMFRFSGVDLRRPEELRALLSREKPDAVVHLAARAGVRSSVSDMRAYFDLNVRGTLCLMEVMKNLGMANLVFASSSSVYGGSEQIPFRETQGILRPLSPYGITKLSCEYYLRAYSKINGMNIIMLRIFTCYGPEQRPDMAFHIFARSIIQGEPITLFNGGDTRRDFTFITDTVECIKRAVEIVGSTGGVRVLNVAGSKPVSVRYALELFQRGLGRNAIIRSEPLSIFEPDVTYGDNTEARKFLGYSPIVPIEEGVKLYCDWVKTVY